MKQSCFTEERMIGILKRASGRLTVAELRHKHVMSDATIYIWRKK